jgi:enamine deaminase RidA (YjgF/YER057c/UK114 family)
MKKSAVNPATLTPPIGHFDRAVRLGEWLFISGVSALTNVSGSVSERKMVTGIDAQTRETLDNLERVLKAAGGNLSQIYEMRITLKQRSDYPAVNAVLKERFPDKGYVLQCSEGVLLHPDMEIYLEANAHLGVVT